MTVTRSDGFMAAAVTGAVAALFPAAAAAQLRVVSFNTYNNEDTPLPRSPWMNTILSAMGSSVSDDPFLAGNTGIIKPIDVLALQEVDSAAVTVSAYRNLMNGLYPGANYQYDAVDGATTGAGTQGLVYNANALTLIATKKVGISSGSGQPRQALRYQLRPVGYGSAADVFVYNSHYKAGQNTVEEPNLETRRLIEAQAIRTDADALGAGRNIIYLGDFNVYRDDEPMFQHLISAGNGQALDPINQIGDWHNNSAYKKAWTQSPYSAATAASLGTGFTIGAGGGMDDRFDWQMITANLNDQNGVAYIPNSYQAFGNNGTITHNQAINFAGNTAQPQNVLDAMAGILDHVPVVADYQIPARLAVSVASVPAQVIVGGAGGAGAVDVAVSNSAPVMYAIGADGLGYSLTTSGAVSGSASGNDNALGSGNTHAVTLNTATPGNKTGSINVTSASEAVANGTFAQAVSYAVLDHARPSFSAASDDLAASVDFGYVPIGSSMRSAPLAIHNRVATAGFTAGLDVDGASGSGSTAQLGASIPTITSLAAGSSAAMSATLDAATAGNLSATYTIASSDQNLPGAIARSNLVVTSTARVFSVASFPVNGFMFLRASEPLTIAGPFSIAAGVTLDKTGPGAMTINGAHDNGVGSQLLVSNGVATFNFDAAPAPAGATLAVTVKSGAGATFNTTQHLASLSIPGGTATVGGGVLVADALAIAAGGKLDLRDNKLILRAGAPGGGVGSWNGASYTGLTALIQSGRNGGGGGAWNGPGLVTSDTRALNPPDFTTLAIATAGELGRTTFAGETVAAGDVLVLFTYGGDANLDGKVNIDDYGQIDFNAGSSGIVFGYFNGDFNYDGKINIDDYGIIDFNVAAQGAAFATAVAATPRAAGAVHAVPEPSLLALPLLCCLAARRRRVAARGF